MAKTVTRTLRAAPEFWARLKAAAEVEGKAVNVAALEALESYVEMVERDGAPELGEAPPKVKAAPKAKAAAPDPKRVLAEAEASAAHLGLAPRIQGAAGPGAAGGPAASRVSGIEGIQVGAVRPAYGSRLRGAPRGGGRRV